MPDFHWKAARADSQIVEGQSTATGKPQVIQQLRAQGLTPLEISEGVGGAHVASVPTAAKNTPATGPAGGMPRLQAPTGAGAGWFKGKGLSAGDVLVMTSELSIMLKAGLSLDNALRVLIGMSSKPEMMQLTEQLLASVKRGVPLSGALAEHPLHFNSFYVNMVRSGEASGQLSAVLERLVEHLERLRALRESVVSAIIYPSILMVVALLSLIAMLGFVVPQFEPLFNDMGDALPLATRIVMEVGRAFRENAPLIGLILLGGFTGVRAWFRSPRGHAWWQARMLRLSLFGPLIVKYDLTLFSRSLGTLLGNGVPLMTALTIATQTVGNDVLRGALEGVAPRVKGGGKMVDALRESSIFEPLAISLIQVGEETGRMGPMLLELARIFNRDVETGIKRGLTLLEPALILVLGLIIASVIVSILLGILSINDLAV